jgi:hypothetical protein
VTEGDAVEAEQVIDPRAVRAAAQDVVYTSRACACALAFQFRPVKG